MSILYDKAGGAFSLDHEYDGTAYMRPMVKVVMQSSYGDDFHETEELEPAEYLVAMARSELFDAPPVAVIDEELAAKRAELDALKADAQKVVRGITSARSAAERELQTAQRQLDSWMKTHRVMMDLGKLLDGQVLYPLSVRKNPYHHSREIPRIPTMRNAKYLAIDSGDFEKGQKWVCRQYGSDNYGCPFRFFDTEEERAAEIRAEFDEACEAFRAKPNFETTGHTTLTTLHYGTLMEWVERHPALAIPDDIEAMKTAADADLIEKRRVKLAAELAALDPA